MKKGLKRFIATIIMSIILLTNNGTLVLATEITENLTEEPAVAQEVVASEPVQQEETAPPEESATQPEPAVEAPKSSEPVVTEPASLPSNEAISDAQNTAEEAKPETQTTEVTTPEENVSEEMQDETVPEAVQEEAQEEPKEESKVQEDVLPNDAEETDEEEISMPECDFSGTEGDIIVNVHADEGAFPKGTTMELRLVQQSEVYDVVNNAVEGEVATIKAVDITFKYEGKEIEPKNPISVNMKTTKTEDTSNNKVVHIDDNKKVDVLNEVPVKKETVNLTADFNAKDFSVYAIVTIDDDGNEVAPYVNYRVYKFFDLNSTGTYEQYNFLNKNGDTVTQEKVKNGDTLEQPTTPYHEGYKFEGWFVSTDNGETFGDQVDFSSTISGIDTTQKVDDEVINVYAKYSNVCMVYFYETLEATTILTTRVVPILDSTGTGTLDISGIVAPKTSSNLVFEGWKESADATDVIGDTLVINSMPEGKKMYLYPSFAESYYIYFVGNGTGATYISPIFVKATDEVTESLKPTDPTREGYDFAGWYDAAEGGNEFSWSGYLTADKTLYAHWTPKTVSYKVLYWLENADDENYTYLGSKTMSGQSGAQTAAAALTNQEKRQYSDVTWDGFTVQTITQQTISGEGSTIVNVYYNRNVYTVHFYENEYWNPTEYTDLKITAKYGADIHAEWPGTKSGTEDYGALWRVSYNSSTMIAGLSTMPLNGDSYYSVNGGDYRYNSRLMVQNIDGSNNFTLYIDRPFTYNDNDLTTTADDYTGIKGFSLNANSSNDARSIRNNANGDENATYNSNFNRSPRIGASSYPNTTVTINGKNYHTLYYYYLRNQYNISFMSNGTEVSKAENIYYQADISNVAPTNYVVDETTATIDGHTKVFQGWYDNVDCNGAAYDFTGKTMPAGNLVFYAKWEDPWFIVQLDLNGGTLNGNDPSITSQATWFWVEYGETITEYTPHRDFYASEGGTYYYHNNLRPDDDTIDRLAYYTEDVSLATDTSTTYKNENNAYQFLGWHKVNSDGTIEADPFSFSTEVTEDIKIQAQWRRIGTYTLAYDPTGKDDQGNQTATGSCGTDNNGYANAAQVTLIEAPTGITANYVFDGWEIVDDDGNVIDNNNGSYYKPGAKIVLNAEEWANENKVIKLRAHYTKASESEETLDVTFIIFNANGGTTSVTASDNITVSDNNVTISNLNINDNLNTYGENDFSREGYILDGWNTDQTAANAGTVEFKTNQLVGVDNLTPKDNTVYAVWILEDELIYNKNADDATGTMENTVGGVGKKVIVSDNAYTRPGYTFSGWNTKANGTGTAYANGAEYTLQENVDDILYAQWTANTNTPYTVEHYKQNLDGTYPDTASETESKTGTTGAQTLALAKSYTGFTAQAFSQETIKGDGSTVVKIYYTRNSHALTINYKYENGTEAATTHNESLKYGADYSVVSPVIAGYTADQTVVAGNMPADNVEVTVKYVANTDTKYKVEHYKENEDFSGYTLAETENLTGTTDTEATAVIKEYTDGYTFESDNPNNVLKGNIAGDGSLVLKVYYAVDKLNDNPNGPDDPEGGDDVPDKYQISLNYKVVNGAWNDETTGDIIDVVTLTERDSEGNIVVDENGKPKYSKEGKGNPEIPGVGEKPNPGFCAGEWDEEVPTIVEKDVDGNTYTYTYEEDKLKDNPDGPDDPENGDGVPDKYQITLNYKVEKGAWNDETTDPIMDVVTLTERDSEGNIVVDENGKPKYSKDGQGEPEVPGVGEKPNPGYCAGEWDETIPATVSSDTEKLEYTYTYEIDNLKDNPDGPDDPETGDGVPDKYQISITFKVENGEWNEGGSDPILDVVTLTERDSEGNIVVDENGKPKYSKDGQGEPEVPEVGEAPNVGFKPGDWDKEIPEAMYLDDDGFDYTYTYEKYKPVESDPPVKKNIIGDTPETAATFKFTLEAIETTSGVEEMPMPEGSNGTKKVKEVKGAGEYEFGIISFEAPGVYTYKITEENTGTVGYKYDTSTYTVQYIIEDVDGELTCERSITKDGDEANEVVFNNEYTKPAGGPTPGESNPLGAPQVVTAGFVKTGDNATIYFIILVIAIFSLAISFKIEPKTEKTSKKIYK